MTDDLVKKWDEYVESMGSVMGDVEHAAQQMRDRIEALEAERDRLLSTVNALESLRPHWAQGYSSDSIAAQASTEALVGIWKILGVNDQTSAVVTLKALTANNVRLRKLLTEAAADLTAYVDAEYPLDTYAEYPHIAKRHHRDMELVRHIQAALNTGKKTK